MIRSLAALAAAVVMVGVGLVAVPPDGDVAVVGIGSLSSRIDHPARLPSRARSGAVRSHHQVLPGSDVRTRSTTSPGGRWTQVRRWSPAGSLAGRSVWSAVSPRAPPAPTHP